MTISQLEKCPSCNSTNTAFNNEFGYHQCNECGNHWAHDKDDPDYEEFIIDDVIHCPNCNAPYHETLPDWVAFRTCGECRHEW